MKFGIIKNVTITHHIRNHTHIHYSAEFRFNTFDQFSEQI